MVEDCVKASPQRSKVSAQALNGAHSCSSLLVMNQNDSLV